MAQLSPSRQLHVTKSREMSQTNVLQVEVL